MNLMFRGIEESIQSVDRKIKRLGDASSNYQEFFSGYLTTEDVLKPRSVRLLIVEAGRLMSLAVSNPLTKEEKSSPMSSSRIVRRSSQWMRPMSSWIR